MDPITIAALANAGFKILGGIGANKDAKINHEIQTLTNQANIEASKSSVMGKYTSVFEEQSKRMGTQKNLLGNVDKASTIYQNTLTEHEKSFLKTENNLKKDLKAIERQGAMTGLQIGMNTQNTINKNNLSITSGMTDAFIYSSYGGKK